MTIRYSAALAAVSFACLSPVAAQAADISRAPVRITVRHGDLNLARKSGRDQLAGRIDRAARRACMSTLAGLAGTQDSRRCRDEMLRDADVQLASLQKTAPVEVASRR